MKSAVELNAKGAELYQQGDPEGARWHYMAAMDVDPDFLHPQGNISSALAEAGYHEASIVACRRFLAQEPTHWRAWNTLGTRLMLLFRYDEAESVMRKAIELAPMAGECYHNLALLCHRQGRQIEALELIRKVMALGNDRPNVMNDYAHILLKAHGPLQEALAVYETRWNSLTHLPPWDFHIPEWQGQSLEGKTLLLHGEQGQGDTVMCLRFVSQLEALGANVVVAVPESLLWLCATQGMSTVDVGKVDALLARSFDYQSPMYGAMRWLGTEWDTISLTAFLRAPKIPTRAVNPSAYNIGICWASGNWAGTMSNWLRRVSELREWLPLAERPEVQLWSLQKGHDPDEISRLGAEHLVRDPTASLHNWAETAAFMSQLDLVISVDTCVAHLAGALGLPVWMISQHAACWRWRDIAQGSGAPWYDSMRIFHQSDPLSWAGVLREVGDELKSLNLRHNEASKAA